MGDSGLRVLGMMCSGTEGCSIPVCVRHEDVFVKVTTTKVLSTFRSAFRRRHPSTREEGNGRTDQRNTRAGGWKPLVYETYIWGFEQVISGPPSMHEYVMEVGWADGEGVAAACLTAGRLGEWHFLSRPTDLLVNKTPTTHPGHHLVVKLGANGSLFWLPFVNSYSRSTWVSFESQSLYSSTRRDHPKMVREVLY